MRITAYCCIILLLFSCTRSKFPKDVLPPEKMQTVLWDIVKADVWTTDYILKDSSKIAIKENASLQKQIFRQNQVTKDQFYKSYEYYSKHPDIMNVLLDSIIIKQSREKNKNNIKRIKDL